MADKTIPTRSNSILDITAARKQSSAAARKQSLQDAALPRTLKKVARVASVAAAIAADARDRAQAEVDCLALVRKFATRATLLVDDQQGHFLRQAMVSETLGRYVASRPALTSIDLSNNTILEPGMRALAKALWTNDTVTSLNLSHCAITCRITQEHEHHLYMGLTKPLKNPRMGRGYVYGLWDLAQYLERTHMLTSLDLSFNDLNDLQSSEGPRIMADCLAANITLTSLKYEGNNLCEGVDVFSEFLVVHPTLTHLDLSRNNLQQSAVTVFDRLNQRKARGAAPLLHLNLENNVIGPDTGGRLYEAICILLGPVVRTRAASAVVESGRGKKGRAEVTRILEEINGIESLRLTDNPIGSKDGSFGKCLARALGAEPAPCLRALDVERCCVSPADVECLAVGLRCNEQLTSLNLSTNSLG
jgi:Ran GTPase-activating protein (RanGAP) involved in mRNA processing and transport